MINITRSIILSKIDYALPIYGWCAKSHIKLIKTPYHAAIRRCIGAFRTSPIINILREAGMPSIENRTSILTFKLIPKLFASYNKILYQEVCKTINYKKSPKIESVILKCIKFSRTIDLKLRPLCLKQPSEPPWLINRSYFNTSLANLPKSITPATIYKQTFKSLSDDYIKHNWNFLYTDGSESEYFTTFAVCKHDGKTISSGHLFNYCSNFTAEALAISLATDFATTNDGKYVICTDSLSSILAIQSSTHYSPLIRNIRNTLIANPNKIKLMWVPSHIGILGNEYADSIANSAKHMPLLSFPTWESGDIISSIYSHLEASNRAKWDSYQHMYKSVNPLGCKPNFPKSCSRYESTIITRLRLGHSRLSHKHLLEKEHSPQCSSCHTQLNILHILDECSSY